MRYASLGFAKIAETQGPKMRGRYALEGDWEGIAGFSRLKTLIWICPDYTRNPCVLTLLLGKEANLNPEPDAPSLKRETPHHK